MGMEDRQLLRLLERDPAEGIAVLEELYTDPVWFAAAQRLAGAEDIRECVHDTFVDFYLSLGNFDPSKGSIRGYLLAIVRRKASRRYRENQQQCAELEAGERIVSTIAQWEQRQELDAALSRLPETDREALRLHYFHGYTAREIAGELGMSHEAAMKRLQWAVKKLRRLMEE